MTNETGRRTYFALGDSLTAGTGAEAGEGFVHLYHELVIQTVGKQIDLCKFGTVGAKTNELLHKLRTEPDMRSAAAEASLITVTTGGNDLMQAAIPFFLEGQYLHLTSSLRTFVAGLRQLLSMIHALKQDHARPYMVLVISLYNPLPQIPIADKWVRRYNKYTQMMARSRSVYVNVYDAFVNNEYEYLSEDLVHPNTDGYRAIAHETFRALPPSKLRELFA